MNFQRLNKLERQVNKTKSEMNDFNREQVIANSSFTKVAEHVDKISNKFGAIATK